MTCYPMWSLTNMMQIDLEVLGQIEIVMKTLVSGCTSEILISNQYLVESTPDTRDARGIAVVDAALLSTGFRATLSVAATVWVIGAAGNCVKPQGNSSCGGLKPTFWPRESPEQVQHWKNSDLIPPQKHPDAHPCTLCCKIVTSTSRECWESASVLSGILIKLVWDVIQIYDVTYCFETTLNRLGMLS